MEVTKIVEEDEGRHLGNVSFGWFVSVSLNLYSAFYLQCSSYGWEEAKSNKMRTDHSVSAISTTTF